MGVPEIQVRCECLLGESPIWDSRQQRILWLDILNKQIHQYSPALQRHQTVALSKMPGCIAVDQYGKVMIAVEDGFAYVDLHEGQIEMIAEIKEEDNRFNDGKLDPAGRFWAGTMSRSGKPGAGNLYALERDGTISLKIAGVSCSNGMAWSSDNKRFYYIDTPTGKVVGYDYNLATGKIANKTVIIDIPPAEGKPDGMTIDNEGMLWVALWDGCKVIRVDPKTGKILQRILLPVSRVTSCTFGGADLQDLYITSARTGLSSDELTRQPLAGSLFVIKNTGFKGTITNTNNKNETNTIW